MHVLDGDARHAFGRVHSRADAGFGAVEMGDHAGLQAADLARADVERGHDALALASYRRRVSHPPALKPRLLMSFLWQSWCSPSAPRLFAAPPAGPRAPPPPRAPGPPRA